MYLSEEEILFSSDKKKSNYFLTSWI